MSADGTGLTLFALQPFNHGAMRECYRLWVAPYHIDFSAAFHGCCKIVHYVLKDCIPITFPRNSYFAQKNVFKVQGGW